MRRKSIGFHVSERFPNPFRERHSALLGALPVLLAILIVQPNRDDVLNLAPSAASAFQPYAFSFLNLSTRAARSALEKVDVPSPALGCAGATSPAPGGGAGEGTPARYFAGYVVAR
jgi:hypothetical protein